MRFLIPHHFNTIRTNKHTNTHNIYVFEFLEIDFHEIQFHEIDFHEIDFHEIDFHEIHEIQFHEIQIHIYYVCLCVCLSGLY